VSGPSLNARVTGALWTVYILWGSTYLAIKIAGETIPAFFASSVRFLLAGTIMAGFVALRSGTGSLRVGRREIASAALIGLLLPGANGLLFIAEHNIPTGLASLIFASVPLTVIVLRLVTGERPAASTIAAVAVGFLGVALLLNPQGDTKLWAIALTVASAVCWATGSFLSSRLPLPTDPFVATAFEMLLGGLIMLPIGIAQGPTAEVFTPESLLALLYLIVFGSIVGYTAYVWLLANAPVQRVATYAYVNPVIAVALGALLLDESVTMQMVAGALVVLVAVAVVVRRETVAPQEPYVD
jgi:drug/metabolite transporter (DMT)-like permease